MLGRNTIPRRRKSVKASGMPERTDDVSMIERKPFEKQPISVCKKMPGVRKGLVRGGADCENVRAVSTHCTPRARCWRESSPQPVLALHGDSRLAAAVIADAHPLPSGNEHGRLVAKRRHVPCKRRASASKRTAPDRSPAFSAERLRSRAAQARAAMRMSGVRSVLQREQIGVERNRAPQTGQLAGRGRGGRSICVIGPQRRRGTHSEPWSRPRRPPGHAPARHFPGLRSGRWLPPDRPGAWKRCARGNER